MLSRPLLLFALWTIAFAAFVAYCFWRRDRNIRKGVRPLYSRTAGVQAGLAFVSPPLARVLVYPDALVLQNFDLIVPLLSITAIRLDNVLGGPVVVIEHTRTESSPITISVGSPHKLYALLSSLCPGAPVPGTPPQAIPLPPRPA